MKSTLNSHERNAKYMMNLKGRADRCGTDDKKVYVFCNSFATFAISPALIFNPRRSFPSLFSFILTERRDVKNRSVTKTAGEKKTQKQSIVLIVKRKR